MNFSITFLEIKEWIKIETLRQKNKKRICKRFFESNK